MKKKVAIGVICVIYSITILAIYLYVNGYIENKDNRLRKEALVALDSFFEQKPMYVDLLYGPNSFKYKEMQIPQPKTPDINSPQLYIDLHKDENLSWGEAYERVEQNLYNVWKEKYGNITNMYDLDIYPTDSETTLKSGWALKIVSKIPDKFNVLTPVPGSGIQTFLLFPSKVAYKKVAPILQGSIPTVETAVEESLNFEINNEKSDLQPYYSRGSTYNLIKKMKRLVDNEYYYLEKDNIPLVSYYDRESYSNDEPFESGGMHNGYYEVTFKRTQPITYSINRVDKSVIQNEKYILMMIYIATATIAAIIVFMLTIKKR